MSHVVLHGGALGGEVAEVEDLKPGIQMRFDDPGKPGRRKLVYEVRVEVDQETDEERVHAVFVGTEQ